MDAASITSKRRKFRFSLRLLVIITTVVCFYFACWRPTVTSGVADVSARLTRENGGIPSRAVAKAPLFLANEVNEVRTDRSGTTNLVTKTTYYFWFFGGVMKTPFSKEWVKPASPQTALEWVPRQP